MKGETSERSTEELLNYSCWKQVFTLPLPAPCSALKRSSSLADVISFTVRAGQDCGISNGFLFRAVTVTKSLNLDVSWSLEIKIEAFDHSCLVGTGGTFDWGPDLISRIEWLFSDIQGGS